MDLLRDLRLALRDLLKAPWYTFAAVVTLALAIGANSAIFSVVHAVLLKPLPINKPDHLVIFDRLTTMDAIVSRAVAPWRFSVWMFTLFAAFAFVLAAVGLFSLVSLDVAQRRHEFAVRLALGAQRADVLRSVLLAAGWRVLSGVALGLLTAIVGTRGIRSLLIGVEALDTTTYAAVIVLVLTVVAVASYLPARRAAETDPLALLRRE
jgi:putative ABC transport system permease protein